MASDRMYELALAYKKTKLWKRFTEDMLFGVRLSNGMTGYCSIMGRDGEYNALALYLGAEGLSSYWMMAKRAGDETEMEALFIFFSTDCLQCAFENKADIPPAEIAEAKDYGKRNGISYRGKNPYPRFMKLAPFVFPRPIDRREDEQLLAEALEAALEVHAKLGCYMPASIHFTAGSSNDRDIPVLERKDDGFSWSMEHLPKVRPNLYPEPVLSNELLAKRLKRARKKNQMVCDLCMIPSPTAKDGDLQGERFYVSVTLLVIDPKKGDMTPAMVGLDYGEENASLLSKAAEFLMKYPGGVPADIHVGNKRTYAFLRNLCKQAGIRLHLHDDMEELEDVEDSLLRNVEDLEAESADDEDMNLTALQHSAVEAFSRLSDRDLRTMPSEMRTLMKGLLAAGMLPKEVETRVIRVLGKNF